MHRLVLGLLFFHPSALSPQPFAKADDPIDSPMYRDPDLPAPRVVTRLPPRLPGLWLEALTRPETDLKAKAAQAVALAHERGLSGMDVAVEPLTRELGRPDQHPTVRVAVARALVVLDAKGSADALARAADADADVRDLVEPALARWDYQPARAGWLERIGRPPTGRGTVLAIRSLAAVKEPKAADRLRELARGRDVPVTVRVEAARALGVIRPAGSEEDARALAADASRAGVTDRLVAAHLLRHHSGDPAVRQLQALGRDPEPAVAAVALARLLELDPQLVIPLLDPVLASPDANVRAAGVEALFRRPSDAHLKLLGDRLNDPHPDLRARARRALRELAGRPEWKPTVIREGTRLLGGADWRGLEQSAVLLAQLGHKPAAGRLVELLPHDRPEALVAAAWGLRALAVPETLGPALDYFDRTYRAISTSGASAGRTVPAEALDRQLSQLAQFLGRGRHRAADGLFRRLIPSGQAGGAPAGPETRAAAIWALGLFHEDKPVPEIGRALDVRIRAIYPTDVEDPRVRRMAVITLGRMKAADHLPTLREFRGSREPSPDPVSNACGWSIERITGEKVPPPGVIEVTRVDWFLVPTE